MTRPPIYSRQILWALAIAACVLAACARPAARPAAVATPRPVTTAGDILPAKTTRRAIQVKASSPTATRLPGNNVDPEKKADASVLGTSLTDAGALLGTYKPTYDWKNDPNGVRDQFIMLAGILGGFNEGLMGVPHCD